MNTAKLKRQERTGQQVTKGGAGKDGECKKTHIRLPPIRTWILEKRSWIILRFDIPSHSHTHLRRHFFWEQHGRSNRVFAEPGYLSSCAIRRYFRELHASPQQHRHTQRSISRCLRKLYQVPIRALIIR